MGGTRTSKFHDLWICGPLGTLIHGFKYTEILLKKNENLYGNMFLK